MGDSAVLLCTSCGYNVAGLPDGLCPECGKSFTRKQIRKLELRARSDRRLILCALWTIAAAPLLGGGLARLGPGLAETWLSGFIFFTGMLLSLVGGLLGPYMIGFGVGLLVDRSHRRWTSLVHVGLAWGVWGVGLWLAIGSR